MIHRHLAYPSGTSAEELPSAAIVDLLDRGDLDAWRPLAVAIGKDPHGPLADRVLHLIDAYPMYGTSALWRTWIERCRVREEGRSGTLGEQTLHGVSLAGLRRRVGLTQAVVAGRMMISQSDLSKLERRADVRLSSLRAYAAAIGARVELVVTSVGERFELRVGPAAKRPPARSPRRADLK